jgi:CheY-like chemotaxis protein
MHVWLLIEDSELRNILAKRLAKLLASIRGEIEQVRPLQWDGDWEGQLAKEAQEADGLILQAYRMQEAVVRVRRLRLLAGKARGMRCIVLTLETPWDLLGRLPEALIFFSPGTALRRLPQKPQDLVKAILDIPPVSSMEGLEPYLMPYNLRWEVERREKHRQANRLGLLHLLDGLRRAGYIEISRWQALRKRITDRLRQDFPEVEEYAALTGLLEVKTEDTALRPWPRPPDPFRVLLIDDEAHLGWDEILAALFTPGCASPHWEPPFRVFRDGGTELWVMKEELCRNTDEVWRALQGSLRCYGDYGYLDWDLIFLDLRLQPDEFKKRDIEEISGFQLFRRIRDLDPTVPVLVFTASERASFIRGLEHLGIVGYYVKAVSEEPDVSRQKAEDLIESVDEARRRLHLRALWRHIVCHVLPSVETSAGAKARQICFLLCHGFLQFWAAAILRAREGAFNDAIITLYRFLESLRQGNLDVALPISRWLRQRRNRYVHYTDAAPAVVAYRFLQKVLEQATGGRPLLECRDCFGQGGRQGGIRIKIERTSTGVAVCLEAPHPLGPKQIDLDIPSEEAHFLTQLADAGTCWLQGSRQITRAASVCLRFHRLLRKSPLWRELCPDFTPIKIPPPGNGGTFEFYNLIP